MNIIDAGLQLILTEQAKSKKNLSAELLADSKVRFAHLICEGEIEGLVKGVQSIYINDVPMYSAPAAETPGASLTIDCAWYCTPGLATSIRSGRSASDYVVWSTDTRPAAGSNILKVKAGYAVSGPNIQVGTKILGVSRTPTPQFLLSKPLSEKTDRLEGGNVLTFTPDVNAEVRTFDGVSIDYRLGTTDQTCFGGFNTIETQLSGVNNQTPIETTLPATVYVPPDSYNAVKLDIYAPVLSSTDKNTGAVSGVTVEFKIERQSENDGSTWTSLGTATFAGKATSPYSRQYRIELPEPWLAYTIRITRVTLVSTSNLIQDKIYLRYAMGVRDLRLSYPNSVIFAGEVEAKAFPSLPRITYHLKLLKIKVPLNYDPITRVYATSGVGTTGGVWNGEFKTVWSDNPAWCFYDLATNPRYGLGGFVTEADIDKWTLYTIAQYCDELVPDGRGGEEPRFTCNLFLQEREEAIRVLANMASIFRGIAFWANGKMQLMTDRPGEPVHTFTNANVSEGVFTYSGTPLRNRHTVALVSWNDPSDFSKVKVEYVEDTDGIQRFGIREIELTALGANSRGQAYRQGKMLLASEQAENEMVAFETGLDGALVSPGEIVNICDRHKSGKRVGGRCFSADINGIDMDTEFDFVAGKTYYAIMTQGSLRPLAAPLVNPGTVASRRLQFVTAIAPESVPAAGTVFAIGIEGELVPQQYRVIGIQESKAGKFVFNATYYNPSKYEAVEQGIALTELPTSVLPDKGFVSAPTGVTLNVVNHVVQEGVRRELHVGWAHTASTLIKEYVVEISRVSETWTEVARTSSCFVAVPFTLAGLIFVRVRAVNIFGVVSAYGTADIVADSDYIPVPQIVGLEMKGQANNEFFSGHDVELAWRVTSPSTAEDSFSALPAPNIDYFDIKVQDLNTSDPNTVYRVLRTDRVVTPSYYYSFEMNNQDTGGAATRGLRFTVSAKDSQGRNTDPRTMSVTNPAPAFGAYAAPTPDPAVFRVTSEGSTKFFNFNKPTDADFSEMLVFISRSPTFAVSDIVANGLPTAAALSPYNDATNNGALLYRGAASAFSVKLSPGLAYKVIYCPLDRFGFAGANYYGPVSVPVTSAMVDTTPPTLPSPLTLSSVATQTASGETQAVINIVFNRNVEADLASYGYSLTPSNGVAIYGQVPARAGDAYIENDSAGRVRITVPVLPGVTYSVSVWAIDMSGNRSSVRHGIDSVIAALDTTPPSSPISVTATAERLSVRLGWTRGSEVDLAYYEVYQSLTATPEPDAQTSATDEGDFTSWLSGPGTIGVPLYFWVRAVDRNGNRSAWSSRVTATPSALTNADIADIEAAKLTGTIGTTQIADDAITAAKIAAGQIIAGKLAANAVVAGNIAAGAIVANNIQAGAITTDKLAAGSITSDKIAAGSITAEMLDAEAITADKIVAGSLTLKSFSGASAVFNPKERYLDESDPAVPSTKITKWFDWTPSANGSEISVHYYDADYVEALGDAGPSAYPKDCSKSTDAAFRYAKRLARLRRGDAVIFSASTCAENAAKVISNSRSGVNRTLVITGLNVAIRPLVGNSTGKIFMASLEASSNNVRSACYSLGKDAILINFETPISGQGLYPAYFDPSGSTGASSLIRAHDYQITGSLGAQSNTLFAPPALATEAILSSDGMAFYPKNGAVFASPFPSTNNPPCLSTRSALFALPPAAVQVSEYGCVSLAATTPTSVEPVMIEHPQNSITFTDPAASTVYLAARATGTPAPTYQWFKRTGGSSAAIIGASRPVLCLYSTAGNHAAKEGIYYCVATNSAGVATSTDATVIIGSYVAASIVTNLPPNVFVGSGATVQLTLEVVGHPYPSFEWFKNGVRIEGAISKTLTLYPGAGRAGDYYCRISNSNLSSMSSAQISNTCHVSEA